MHQAGRFLVLLASIICFSYAGFLLFLTHIDFGIVFLFSVSVVLFLYWSFYEFMREALKSNRMLRRVWLIALILAVGSILFMEMLIYSGTNDSIPEDVEYVIVLGSGLKDGEPSLALRTRLDIAYEYFRQHPETFLIVSGGLGLGEKRTEGDVMKEYLVNKGVPAERVIKEEKATSTYENLKLAKGLIPDFEVPQKALIVTNDFHLFRSKMIAERLGYEAYGLPAETPKRIWVQVHIREYAAILNTYLFQR